MGIFRYEMTWWYDHNNEVVTDKGFIAAKSYGKAANKLVAYCTNADGKCDLISMELMEISDESGMIYDDEILEMLCGGKE